MCVGCDFVSQSVSNPTTVTMVIGYISAGFTFVLANLILFSGKFYRKCSEVLKFFVKKILK